MNGTIAFYAGLVSSQVWAASADSGTDFMVAGAWVAFSVFILWRNCK